MSEQRAAVDAATFFRRAIDATGVVPDEVATDCAAAYPPALAAGHPRVVHETGKAVQERVERDHQHLTGRMRGMRGFKALSGAWVLCAGHAFLRNLRGGFYDLALALGATTAPVVSAVVQAWDAITAELLAR